MCGCEKGCGLGKAEGDGFGVGGEARGGKEVVGFFLFFYICWLTWIVFFNRALQLFESLDVFRIPCENRINFKPTFSLPRHSHPRIRGLKPGCY